MIPGIIVVLILIVGGGMIFAKTTSERTLRQVEVNEEIDSLKARVASLERQLKP